MTYQILRQTVLGMIKKLVTIYTYEFDTELKAGDLEDIMDEAIEQGWATKRFKVIK